MKTWCCGVMPLALLGGKQKGARGTAQGLKRCAQSQSPLGPGHRPWKATSIQHCPSASHSEQTFFPVYTLGGHVWRRWRGEPPAAPLGSSWEGVIGNRQDQGQRAWEERGSIHVESRGRRAALQTAGSARSWGQRAHGRRQEEELHFTSKRRRYWSSVSLWAFVV